MSVVADQALSARVGAELDTRRTGLIELSHAIHADPELGDQEHHAAARCTRMLAGAGFSIAAVVGHPTAFAATYGTGELVVAVCVEYDALPGIGHGCGHNVNAASAVGAALGLAAVADDVGITVLALGTPAEETRGGKVDLIDAGYFDDVALAVMAHAAGEDAVGVGSLALCAWDVTYDGRPAHAAVAPTAGVNALDAMVVAQTAIALARQQLPRDDIVSVIVTSGGIAPNVIPAQSTAVIELRSPTIAGLRQTQARIRACLEAGALAAGCTLSVTPKGHEFADMRQDAFLSSAYQDALRDRGRDVPLREEMGGSTDMGNVSQVVPSIHPMIGYDVQDAVHHTADFASYGTTESADRAVVDAAYGLAAAAVAAATSPVQRDRLLALVAERHAALGH